MKPALILTNWKGPDLSLLKYNRQFIVVKKVEHRVLKNQQFKWNNPIFKDLAEQLLTRLKNWYTSQRRYIWFTSGKTKHLGKQPHGQECQGGVLSRKPQNMMIFLRLKYPVSHSFTKWTKISTILDTCSGRHKMQCDRGRRISARTSCFHTHCRLCVFLPTSPSRLTYS